VTPVEAVARALCSEVGGNLPGMDDEIEAQWPLWKDAARAALAALRDCGVTEEMQEAYDDMDGMGGSLESCFSAMLDAALDQN
jgi:hypothetical protein